MARASFPHGCAEMIPEGAEDVFVEVSPDPGITRLVFAVQADGGWYACLEPLGAGACGAVDQFL
eukprot:5196644-Alexandrium_andersonii.AAC.1